MMDTSTLKPLRQYECGNIMPAMELFMYEDRTVDAASGHGEHGAVRWPSINERSNKGGFLPNMKQQFDLCMSEPALHRLTRCQFENETKATLLDPKKTPIGLWTEFGKPRLFTPLSDSMHKLFAKASFAATKAVGAEAWVSAMEYLSVSSSGFCSLALSSLSFPAHHAKMVRARDVGREAAQKAIGKGPWEAIEAHISQHPGRVVSSLEYDFSEFLRKSGISLPVAFLLAVVSMFSVLAAGALAYRRVMIARRGGAGSAAAAAGATGLPSFNRWYSYNKDA